MTTNARYLQLQHRLLRRLRFARQLAPEWQANYNVRLYDWAIILSTMP